MRQERIETKKVRRKPTLPEILPLDPRDPEILHAKELIRTQVPPRRRAA